MLFGAKTNLEIHKNKSSIRNGKIDILKFIFSMIIVFFHFSRNTHSLYGSTLFDSRGYLAVEFFFIVSGYLFAKSLSGHENNAEGTLKFLLGKYKSVFPCHIIACTAAFAVYCIIEKWSAEELFGNIIKALPDIFLIQMFGIHHSDILKYEWYISAMLIVMFFLTPIMLRFRDKFYLYIAPIIAAVSLGILYSREDSLDTLFNWYGFIYSGTLRALGEISIGCICFRISRSGIPDRLGKPALLTAEFLIYSFLIAGMNGSFSAVSDFAFLPITALGITISFSRGSEIKFLSNRFTAYLGKLSLPIYLNQVFFKLLIQKVQFQYGYLKHIFLYTAATILTASLTLLIIRGFKEVYYKIKNQGR